jgi:hypothetical protein
MDKDKKKELSILNEQGVINLSHEMLDWLDKRVEKYNITQDNLHLWALTHGMLATNLNAFGEFIASAQKRIDEETFQSNYITSAKVIEKLLDEDSPKIIIASPKISN